MQARISAIHTIVADGSVKTFRIIPEQPLDYLAGQFVELQLDLPSPDDRGDRRWFTLSSSPTEPDAAITVRFHDGQQTAFKRRLQQLSAGDTVNISQAMGDFVLPLDPSWPLVWIAGGVGLTPFRSMARWLTDNQEQRPVFLLYSGDQQIVQNLLQEAAPSLAATKPVVIDRLRISRTVHDQTIKEPARYYVAGSESFVAEVRSWLQASGISSAAIQVDSFLGYP